MSDKHNDIRILTRGSIHGGYYWIFDRTEKYVDGVGWVTVMVRAARHGSHPRHVWTKETFSDDGS